VYSIQATLEVIIMTFISLITWLLFQLTIWVVLLIFLLPLSVVLWVIFKSLFTNENGRWEVNIRTLQKPFEEAMKEKVKAKVKENENDDDLEKKRIDKISIIKGSGFEMNENTTKVLDEVPDDIENHASLETALTDELSKEAEEAEETRTTESERQAEVYEKEGIVYLDKPTSFPSDYISSDLENQNKEKVE
jgi:hypothetical protein